MTSEMTEQESKEFFEFFSDCEIVVKNQHGDGSMSIENLYAAIKARLKSEATCNCWAKEATDRD